MRVFTMAIMTGLVLAATPGATQPAATPAVSASAAPIDAHAVVSAVRRSIAERYVLPEKRPALDAVLAEGLSSGRYGVTDPAVLAVRINADLERVGRDKHLSFRYDPQQAEVMRAAQNQAVPDPSAMQRQVRTRNHGIAELRMLAGNIRYMDYRNFDWIGPESQTALNAALQFLSGGEAVIIDLRRNGGGSPLAVQHIISHFLEPDKPLMRFYLEGRAVPDTTSTLTELQLPRMIGKPLYVLTSGGTGSAAEELTGHVGGYRLGELVGGATAGAGFRATAVRIEGGFVLSLSIGRSVLASTGRDWEAVGIAPTIATPVAGALDVGQAHALRRLAGSASGEERTRLEALADGLAARHERRATAMPLTAYAGSYGDRNIVVDGERLVYQRGTRLREALVAVGGNRFVFESDVGMVVEFAPSGERVALLLGPVGGSMQGPFERAQ